MSSHWIKETRDTLPTKPAAPEPLSRPTTPTSSSCAPRTTKTGASHCSPFNVQPLYDCETEVIVMHMPIRQYACGTYARPVGKSALLAEKDLSTIYHGKAQQSYGTKMAIYRARSATKRYQLHLRLIFVKCG